MKKLIFIIIFLILFIGSFVLYTNKAFLYSPFPTHYNLTQEMIDLYNLTYDPDITPKQAELLLKGSMDEDILPRPAFHLYDPVYNRAPFGVYTAKKWALNSDVQTPFYLRLAVVKKIFTGTFLYHGDYSWQANVNYYIKGDLDKTYYGLGHILHLIEDMTVPAHSRNDHHIMGEPYEEWAKINTKPEDYNWAEKLYNQGYYPKYLYTIGQVFDELAQYSNKYFFSRDTILSNDYTNPKIVKEKSEDYGYVSQRTYAWGEDENGKLFRLAMIDISASNWRKISPGEKKIENVYIINKGDHKLNTDYWQHLAPRAIIYGAGVIRLFVKEAEYEKKLAQQKQQELSLFQKAQIFINGLLGIGEEEKEEVVIPSEPLPQPKPSRFPESGSLVLAPSESIEELAPELFPEQGVSSEETTDKIEEATSSSEGTVPQEQAPEQEQVQSEPQVKGATVVKGPKTGGTGGISWREATQTSNTEEQQEETQEPEQDITSPDVFIESLIYNYASTSLILEWSSSEIPSVSFDVEYKQGDGDWQNLLASTSETQTSLSISVQDIIYYFRVKGRDEVGNESNWQEKSIAILSKPVIINEIAWMGTSADYNDEWIELYNRADYDIDLSDWILKSDDSSPEIVFISGDSENKTTVNKIISAKGYYLIERLSENDEPDDAISIPADWYGSFSYGLKNSGETLELKDNQENIIDSVDSPQGRWYAGENETERTMERVNPAAAGTDSKNWQTYIGSGSSAVDADGNPILGTPKAQNSVYDANPPSKIDDLAVSDSLGTFLILQWTAPSDEKSSLSLTYDIRYASESISEENWSLVSQIADIPLVENPDAFQLASISGLKYNTTYYFAIKTFDGLNVSEISNVIVYSTGPPPTLAKSAWPVFQRDVGHIGLSPYQGPDFISSSSVNVKWTVNLNFPIYASPVIGLDNTIYIGDIMGKFYAINPINGNIKWTYDTYNYTTNRGGVYSTAALASDGTIYFSAYGHSYLYALTSGGQLKWKYQIGSPNDTGSSPVIGSDGTIYLTSNNYLYAINPDGTLKWDYYISGAFSVSAPALGSDETIYVSRRGSSLRGYLSAFDLDGNPKWPGENITENINATTGDVLTVGSNDIVYLGSYLGSGALAPIRAINPVDGSTIWSYSIGNTSNSAAIGPSGNIYIVNKKGTLYALDSNGNFIWAFSIGAQVKNSPAIDAQEVIYLGSDDRKIYAINPDGSLKWDYQLDDKIYSSPSIGEDGTIYIGSSGGIFYAIGD